MIAEKVYWLKKYNSDDAFREVCDDFHADHSTWPIPSHTTVMRCCQRFHRTGNVEYARLSSHPQRLESDSDLMVFAAIYSNPRASTTQIAHQTGYSQSIVVRKLNKYGYHCYKSSVHQELRPQDQEKRIIFASQALEICHDDPELVSKILFYWWIFLHSASHSQSTKCTLLKINPYNVYNRHSQYPARLILWAGIINRRLVGLIKIDGTLTGEKYMQLLQNEISEKIGELNEQGGYGSARAYLQVAFPGRVIGTHEQLARLPRSPDLNPLDFILWGHIKSTIYTTSPFPTLVALNCHR